MAGKAKFDQEVAFKSIIGDVYKRQDYRSRSNRGREESG